ncbi:MAG TPA: hypothetical protein VM285_02140 [Polyangia bacterium]|nr:hypothetical protein [Polyangia bacterium]
MAAACVVVDLSPVCINLKLTRRDSFPISFTLTQIGAPVDVTGSSFLFTVNTAEDGSGTELFQKTNTNTPDTTGVATFEPTTTDLNQTPSEYFYDVQWTDAAASVRTVVLGTLEIVADITT